MRSSAPASLSNRAPEVVVVGSSPALRSVANSLQEHRVIELSDASQAQPSELRGAGVFIVELRNGAAAQKLARGAPGSAVLMLGTGTELEADFSAYCDSGRQSDFVRISKNWEDEQPDHEALTEIRLRVTRLLTRRACTRKTRRPAARASQRRPRTASSRMEPLHDATSGRIHAGLIASFVGITLKELSQALGRNYTTVHKTPDAAALQEPLGPWARVCELLTKLHHRKEQGRAWLNTPHRELEERAPLRVMLDGRADVVRDMLEAAYLGIPT